jgi:hypothetical protein
MRRNDPSGAQSQSLYIQVLNWAATLSGVAPSEALLISDLGQGLVLSLRVAVLDSLQRANVQKCTCRDDYEIFFRSGFD